MYKCDFGIQLMIGKKPWENLLASQAYDCCLFKTNRWLLVEQQFHDHLMTLKCDLKTSSSRQKSRTSSQLAMLLPSAPKSSSLKKELTCLQSSNTLTSQVLYMMKCIYGFWIDHGMLMRTLVTVHPYSQGEKWRQGCLGMEWSNRGCSMTTTMTSATSRRGCCTRKSSYTQATTLPLVIVQSKCCHWLYLS